MKKAFKKFKRQFSGGNGGDRINAHQSNSNLQSGSGRGRTQLHTMRRASSIDVLNACDHSDEHEVDVLLNDGHDINDLFLGK